MRSPQLHRKPPPLPFDKAPEGICRLCGEPTNEPRRKRWHKECQELYDVAINPNVARRVAWEAADGKCAKCGHEHKLTSNDTWSNLLPSTFDVDHIVPLWKAPYELKYWLPGNLQLLCKQPCHADKTAAEAAERAALARVQQLRDARQLEMQLDVGQAWMAL